MVLLVLIGSAAGTALWLYWPTSVLSKEEVVYTALRPVGSDPLAIARVMGVKLIHRFDLGNVGCQCEAANTEPWDRIWVVVIKGMLIAPSFPGGRPITYTLEVIPDQRPAAIELYSEGGSGGPAPQAPTPGVVLMAFAEAALVVLLLVGAVAVGIGLAWRVTKGFRLASANRTVNATAWRQQFSWVLLAQVIVLPFMVLGTIIVHLAVIFLLIYLAAIVGNGFTILALSRGRS